jgi:hypothetical protein
MSYADAFDIGYASGAFNGMSIRCFLCRSHAIGKQTGRDEASSGGTCEHSCCELSAIHSNSFRTDATVCNRP